LLGILSKSCSSRPIFPSLTNGGSYSVQNSCIRNCPIYKCDGRLTDVDLQKLLIDMQKPERTGKWAYLPNAGLTLMADITSISSQIPSEYNLKIIFNYFNILRVYN